MRIWESRLFFFSKTLPQCLHLNSFLALFFAGWEVASLTARRFAFGTRADNEAEAEAEEEDEEEDDDAEEEEEEEEGAEEKREDEGADGVDDDEGTGTTDDEQEGERIG